MDRKKLIIIGAGIAGISAAHAARSRYPDARIVILSAEEYPFYNRIALNSYICGKTIKGHMELYPLGDLTSRNIECQSGTRVTAIHPGETHIESERGERHDYDSLIIATGAIAGQPDIPGAGLDGVHSLWSLEDATGIRGGLETAGRVFVLGAGVLGVEIALALRDTGKEVTLAANRGWVMPRLFGRDAGELYGRLLEQKGVRLLTDALVSSIAEVGQTPDSPGIGSLRLNFADGSAADTDLVLTMTGARPWTGPAADAGLAVGSGIIVNEYMETSHPGILACGNCIDTADSSGLLWNPAMIQGETAGRNAFERSALLPGVTGTIHLKAPEIPAFAGGSRPMDAAAARAEGLMVLETREPGAYRMLAADADGRIVSASFIGRVSGASEVDRAIGLAREIPVDVLARGEIDEVVDYLRRPVLSELYPGRAWVCRMCGYIYEGEDPPEICPVCSVGKDQFQAA